MPELERAGGCEARASSRTLRRSHAAPRARQLPLADGILDGHAAAGVHGHPERRAQPADGARPRVLRGRLRPGAPCAPARPGRVGCAAHQRLRCRAACTSSSSTATCASTTSPTLPATLHLFTLCRNVLRGWTRGRCSAHACTGRRQGDARGPEQRAAASSTLIRARALPQCRCGSVRGRACSFQGTDAWRRRSRRGHLCDTRCMCLLGSSPT